MALTGVMVVRHVPTMRAWRRAGISAVGRILRCGYRLSVFGIGFVLQGGQRLVARGFERGRWQGSSCVHCRVVIRDTGCDGCWIELKAWRAVNGR